VPKGLSFPHRATDLDLFAIVNDYDKDNLVCFANGTLLALALLHGHVSIPDKHSIGGSGSGRRKAKATV
jgi:hypothetical protein